MDVRKSSVLNQKCVLWRISPSPDGKAERVSEHANFSEGWQAGQSAIYTDREHAYSLITTGGRRLARFGASRLLGAARDEDAWLAQLGDAS